MAGEERRRGRPATPLVWQPSAELLSTLAESEVGYAQQAYHLLRRAMVVGEFGPGQTIALRPLAAALGMSTMPVREALRLLAKDGVVEADAGARFRVTAFAPERYAGILEMRVRLETLALRMAAPHIDDALLKELEELNSSFREVGEQGNRNALHQNFRFHFLLYSRAPSTDLLEVISSIWVRTGPALNHVLRHRHDLAHGYHSHGRLIELLRQKDIEAACLMLERDLRSGAQTIIKGLADGGRGL